MKHFAFPFALILLVSACGGGGSDSASSKSSTGKAAAAAEAPRSGKGIVRGVVSLEGKPPGGRPVNMAADPVCAQMHSKPPTDIRIRNADGKLEGAVVFVLDGPIGAGHPVRAEEPSLDQKGCLYTPRVVALQVGQALAIHNSDETLHNVHAVADKAGGFNSAMPRKNTSIVRRFKAPEVFVRVKCDVHPWMEAHVAVFDHPFFAVTAPDGSFEIGGLPAGKYKIAADHPFLGRVVQELELTEEAPAALDFTLAKS